MDKKKTTVNILLIVYLIFLIVYLIFIVLTQWIVGFFIAIPAVLGFIGLIIGFLRGSSKIQANLSEYELKWSKYWNKKNLRKLELDSPDKLNRFLESPEFWKPFMENLEGIKNASKWLQEAFKSIRTCSKGLQDARSLDYALISVPPPMPLFTRIMTSLNNYFVVGIEAPSGWGKSRLALWVALSQAINGKKIFYFPDPNLFLKEEYQNSLLRILNEKNRVIIIDDFHRRDDSNKFIAFMEDFFIKAKNKKKIVLLLKTRTAESWEKKPWLNGVHVISFGEYLNFWKPKWVERFFRWFEILCISNFTVLKNFLHTDHLVLAKNTESPWAFVSVMVNLKKLITRQLDLPKSLNKLVILTLIYFGFAVSNERGINSEEMYEGLVWIKDNKEEIWTVLEETGGNIWTLITNNDKERFLDNLKDQVNIWRDQPEESSKDIRLLPSEGVPFGPKVPIQAHHIVWWTDTLKDLWNNEWREYRRVKDACELVIVHGCYYIYGIELTLDKKCSILQDCAQVKILDLAATNISSIGVLATCPNLEQLYLSGTFIDDIGSLGNCLDLKILDIYGTAVTDISPLDNLLKLEYLDISYSQVLDIFPLETCRNLKYLNISGSLFLYDLLNGVFDESQIKEYVQFIERLKDKGVRIETKI